MSWINKTDEFRTAVKLMREALAEIHEDDLLVGYTDAEKKRLDAVVWLGGVAINRLDEAHKIRKMEETLS